VIVPCVKCGDMVRPVRAYVWSTYDEGGQWEDVVLEASTSPTGTFRITDLSRREAQQAEPAPGQYRVHGCARRFV
jgi:hypothetical protein